MSLASDQDQEARVRPDTATQETHPVLHTARKSINLCDTQLDIFMVGVVEGINYYSHQFACEVTKSLEKLRPAFGPPHDGAGCNTCALFDKNFPGMRLILAMPDSRLYNGKSALYENAIRSSVLAVCHRFMQPWHVPSQDDPDAGQIEALMKDLSDSIASQEHQVLSGNWRAVTYQHLVRLGLTSMQPAKFYDALREELSPVWHVCGLDEEEKSALTNMPAVREHIQSLLAEVSSFKHEAGQGFVSAEIQPSIFHPGPVADAENAKLVYGPWPSNGTTAACTVCLGLRRVTRSPDGVAHNSCLLFPEVMMSSWIDSCATPNE